MVADREALPPAACQGRPGTRRRADRPPPRTRRTSRAAARPSRAASRARRGWRGSARAHGVERHVADELQPDLVSESLVDRRLQPPGGEGLRDGAAPYADRAVGLADSEPRALDMADRARLDDLGRAVDDAADVVLGRDRPERSRRRGRCSRARSRRAGRLPTGSTTKGSRSEPRAPRRPDEGAGRVAGRARAGCRPSARRRPRPRPTRSRGRRSPPGGR